MIRRIIEIRKTFGLSQEQFANKLGLSRSFINQFETGKKNISDRTIADICREFNVNEAWLRTGDGEMFRPTRRNDEITAFFGDILSSDPDFRHRFVSVLARMTPGEWAILESKIKEIAGEMKKDGQ